VRRGGGRISARYVGLWHQPCVTGPVRPVSGVGGTKADPIWRFGRRGGRVNPAKRPKWSILQTRTRPHAWAVLFSLNKPPRTGLAWEGQMRICLRRREFIAGLGSAAAWPLAAPAQQQGNRVRHISVLVPYDENDPEYEPRVSAFTQALADLGWADGRNLRMDLRWGGGYRLICPHLRRRPGHSSSCQSSRPFTAT
jgi:hypothetical protein